MNPSDEILISKGPYQAVVSPLGASLRRFWQQTPEGTRELAWGYQGMENKKGGQGDVLIPFPGRIPGGRYRFEGRDYELDRNDKEGPNAIHGFVRTRNWSARASQSGVSFRLKLLRSEMEAKGYPFSLDIGVSYEISDSGLTCQFSIQNIGESPAPVAAGFHPYFVLPGLPSKTESRPQLVNSALLTLPARRLIEFAPGFIPTGRVLPVSGTDLDFTAERQLGTTVINNCFSDLARDADGRAWAMVRNTESKGSTRIWMSESLDYLVVYTGEALAGDARRAIAIEPMTCGTDAFNRPEWGLKVLQPWEFLTGSWGVIAG